MSWSWLTHPVAKYAHPILPPCLQALSDPCAHRPYPPRIPRGDEDGPGRDVENGGVPDTENYRPEAGMNEEDPYGRLSTSDSRIPLVVGQYRQDGTGVGGIPSPSEAHVQSRQTTTSNGYASGGVTGPGDARQRVDAVERFR